MAIAVWILGFFAYVGYLLYMTSRPSDLNLLIGAAALILGFLSFLLNKKFLLVFSFVLLFAGVALTYPMAMRRLAVWPFVGGLAAILFFGSLSLRSD